MAFFLFSAHHSSSTSRLNILALIALVLVCCCCSYCSSSSFIPPTIDVDPLIDDIDMLNIDDKMNSYSPTYHYINIPEQEIFPSKNPFLNLLLKSALIQSNYQEKDYNNKRYASQSFHAMRG